MPADYLLLESGDHLLLESGDDLLLESSTEDQTLALPVIDDAQVFGPGVAGQGSINLPLIDDGDTMPPLVFEDKQVDLPLLDDSAVLAPTVTLTGDIELPLIDDATTFAPSVFVEQTAALPLIDGGEAFGPSFSQPQQLDLRFLDGGWAYGPDIIGEYVTGLAVYVGTTLLEPVTTPTFRDPIDDVGSFTVTLANDDADLALCDFDAILRFEVDGRAVFSGIIEDREVVHLAAGEEHDHVTALSGPGYLGIGSQDVIYPSRGVGALPVEEVRSFSWPSIDFDDSTWPFAKQVNLQRSYAGWRAPVPWIWPDTDAWWIWADQPDVTHTFAPGGSCNFRKTFTAADDMRVRIFGAGDNWITPYLDGAELNQNRSFTVGEYIDVDLTAGTHVIAARGLNHVSGHLPNPGGIIMAAYEVGDNGLLGDLVFHTDSTWRCLPYPVRPPGFTPGEVLYLLRAETDIFDGTYFDFTETLDSNGNPWERHPEISVRVGRTYVELLREMAAAGIIDVAAAPGAPVIRAWNYGTRGQLRAPQLDQTVGDPDASEFLQLRHKGHRARLNKALIRYADGWTEKRDTASIAANGTRGGTLELGQARDEGEAQDVAETIMVRRSEPAYSTSGRLLPSSTFTQPYEGYEVGDTILCLDEEGDLLAMRVRGITLDPDEVGVLEWGIELRDIELEVEELHQNALRRTSEGHLIAGARISSPAGSPPLNSVQVTAIDVAEFSTDREDEQLTAGYGPNRRAAKSGNIVEIQATLTPIDDGSPPSTATTLYVYLNGDVLGSLLTIPAGDLIAEIPVARVPVRGKLDVLRPRIVTAGTGARGVDIQVLAI